MVLLGVMVLIALVFSWLWFSQSRGGALPARRSSSCAGWLRMS